MKIKNLTLYTSQLSAQIEFYHHILDLTILDKGIRFVEFKAGSSILRFEEKKLSTPYHFAFNIPSYQEKEALEWLEKKISIIPFETKKIIAFDSWNAKAIYFHDNDHNIVELIARKNLEVKTTAGFSSESILEISEIGIPVEDITPVYEQLKNQLNLEVYSGSTERFCAIGDEHGLFIVINKNKKKVWFPSNDFAYSSGFNTIISNEGYLFNLVFHKKQLFTDELKSNHHSFSEFA